MKAVIISGSSSDAEHVNKITSELERLKVPWEQHVASAHKEPRKVLDILGQYEGETALVYVTVAGRSNALSGFVAANSRFPTLACPPFKDKIDLLINIQSTLQMPSQTPVLTILDPKNCALAVKRILNLSRD